MKKLLIGLGVLIVLLVAGALIGPSFVDWNRYKSDIAAAAEAATGRKLTIDGNIALAILPTPHLSVEGVRLANLAGAASPDMVRLKALNLRVAFAPLLRGRIQVESFELVEPRIDLERLADGRDNWTFAAKGGASSAGGSAIARPSGGSGLPDWLQFDRVTVSKGSLSYRDDKSGYSESVQEIDAAFGITPPLGPFRASGKAIVRSLPVSFEASIERLGGGGPASLGAKLTLSGASLEFAGAVAQQKAGPELTGKLRASGTDLRTLASTLGRIDKATLPPVLAQNFGFEGVINAGGSKLAMSGLSLRLGETEGTGKLDFEPGTPQRGSINLAINRVDLDKWLAAETPASGKAVEPSAKPPAATAPTSRAQGSQGLAFALPGDLDLNIDTTVDALTYKGGVVRQLRVSALLNKGELALKEVRAQLPGGSDVTIFGAMRTPDGKPSFDGNIEAASDNLRGLLDWLKVDTGRVPAERLRKLSLASAIQINSHQVQLRGIDINLDSSHLVGGATILLQQRLAFGASVAVDRLNLDAYMVDQASNSATAAQATAKAAAPAATKSRPDPAVGDSLRMLDSFDGNIRARIDELIWRGERIRGLRFDGTVQAGNVTVREARVDDLAGLKGGLKGSLSGLDQKPKLDLALDLSAAELSPLLRFAGVKSPVAPQELGAVALKGAVKGGFDRLALDLDAKAAGGSYKVKGDVGMGAGGVRYDLDVNAKQPQVSRLLRNFVGDVVQGDLGTLELAGRFKGNTTALSVSGLKLRSAMLDAAGDLSIGGLPDKLAVKADLSAGTRKLGLLMALLGKTQLQSLDQLGPVDAKIKADGTASGFTLDSKLSTSGGSLALAGKVENSAKGPSYNLAVDASHPDLSGLLRAAGYHPTDGKLGDLKLHTKVTGNAEKIDLADLQAQLGPTTLSGPVEVALNGARPKITARLQANAIDLDRFLPAASAGGAVPRPRGQGVTAINPRWSTAPLELAALKSADADVTFAAPSLTYGQYKIEDAKLAAALNNGVLDISGLTGRLLGGALKITGKLNGQGEAKANMSLRLDGANLGQAGLKFGTSRLTTGVLSAAADLSTSGRSEATLVRGLAGNGSLTMQDGTITGIDLQAVNTRISKLDRSLDLIALVQAAASGGQSKVKRLAGTFTMKDGVAINKDLVLDAEGATGKGQGSLDLPRWYMDYDISFNLTGIADAPPFSIKLKGAPDDPRKFVNANALQEYLLKRTAGAIIKDVGKGDKGLGGLLKSLPGMQTPPPATQQPAQQPKSVTPEAIIQDLLKGFGGKKN